MTGTGTRAEVGPGTGAGHERGLRRLVDRRVRARAWSFLRTAPGVAPVTDLLERRLRGDRAVAGLGVPAGTHAPAGATDAPVVLLLAIGCTPEEVFAWTEPVAAAQRGGPPFRPVWLLDSPAFPVLLAKGWAFDHVMPREQHLRLSAQAAGGGGGTYDGYVAERLELWRSRTLGAPVVPLLGPPTSGGAERLGDAVAALTARAGGPAAGRRRSRS